MANIAFQAIMSGKPVKGLTEYFYSDA